MSNKKGVCGLKWVAGYAKNPSRGLPNVTGIQVCNDVDTGLPLAVMDCAYLTGLRTAAVSTVIAAACAWPNAEVLALCGCGFQGGLHLEFLTGALPAVSRVRLFDPRRSSAEALAGRARSFFGGEIEVCDNAEACIRGAGVISTCTNGDEQIIKADWFPPFIMGQGMGAMRVSPASP